MINTTTDTIRANPDAEDCLAEAAARYVAQFPELNGYDLEPRWADENAREEVTVTIPRWFYEALSDTSGT